MKPALPQAHKKMKVRGHGVMTLGTWLAGLLICGSPGAAETLPPRQAGLWEISLVAAQGARRQRPVTVRQCTSLHADQWLLLAIAPGQEGCAEPAVKRTDEGWEVHTACSVHGNPVQTSFTLSGDFSLEYSGHYDTRFGGECVRGSAGCHETQNFSARWVGACGQDMHPGDTLLPNGIIVSAQEANAHGEPDVNGEHQPSEAVEREGRK